jgi:hypothetical protein
MLMRVFIFDTGEIYGINGIFTNTKVLDFAISTLSFEDQMHSSGSRLVFVVSNAQN